MTPTLWRAGQSSQTEDTELPEGQLFSLSSARLKRAHLKLTAEALGVPTGAGAEETRQLIEGHIISINREPGLVQVIVQERRRVMLGLELYLVDQSGVFAEAHTEDFQDTAQSATVTSELEKLCEQLEKANCELERLQHQLHETVEAHERELEKERRHSKQLWRQMCDRVGKLDSALAEKDALIEGLNHQLARATRSGSEDRQVQQLPQAPGEDPPHDSLYPPTEHSGLSLSPSASLLSISEHLHSLPLPPVGRHVIRQREHPVPVNVRRRGKALPVEPFTGEKQDELLDDWLPTLERAGVWNAWSNEELLMQLAGHLRGRALQEWDLLTPEEKSGWKNAVTALKSRLEPRDRAV